MLFRTKIWWNLEDLIEFMIDGDDRLSIPSPVGRTQSHASNFHNSAVSYADD